jgi:hypothetical protein
LQELGVDVNEDHPDFQSRPPDVALRRGHTYLNPTDDLSSMLGESTLSEVLFFVIYVLCTNGFENFAGLETLFLSECQIHRSQGIIVRL